MGCAWLYIYPYVSGELNFTVTTLFHGMRAKQVFPDGIMLISIPYDLLPGMLENLQNIEWMLPAYTEGKEAHDHKFKQEIDAMTQQLLAEQDQT